MIETTGFSTRFHNNSSYLDLDQACTRRDDNILSWTSIPHLPGLWLIPELNCSIITSKALCLSSDLFCARDYTFFSFYRFKSPTAHHVSKGVTLTLHTQNFWKIFFFFLFLLLRSDQLETRLELGVRVRGLTVFLCFVRLSDCQSWRSPSTPPFLPGEKLPAG